MKVDPNEPINKKVEHVLCRQGSVHTYDGSSTPAAQLNSESNAFKAFCQSLDPNTCFIIAIVPDHADDELFFKARDVARQIPIHMQAGIERPEDAMTIWEHYKRRKALLAQPEENSNK
ncbi:MAG: hypothetical protein ABH878_03195 [bacterium]